MVVGQSGNLRNFGFAGETINVEVRTVDFENERGLRRDRFFVIVKVRFIGRSHLHELCSGGFKNFRNPESATDFHELGS